MLLLVPVQKFLVRAVTAATELDDQRYLTKAGAYRQLLVTMMATMDSYLREYLRRIGSASRINSRSQKKWQETPEVSSRGFGMTCYGGEESSLLEEGA